MMYKIAGKVFKFSNHSSKILDHLLDNLLNLYPISDRDTYDVLIRFEKEKLNDVYQYSNPKIHKEYEHGFSISSLYGEVLYQRIGGKPEFSVFLNQLFFSNSSVSRFFSNGEFSSLEDKLSSVLYEQLIVPALFFIDDIALIHSTGIFSPNGKGILIGGTGGIGKTSMEIELCFNGVHRFINDDIGIVNSKGHVFPNYAHPKIYGYNMEGNDALKDEIFRKRSALDKWAWTYKKKRSGIAKVRRKINPKSFRAIDGQAVALNHYFLMSRHASDKFDCDIQNGTQAAIDTQMIIESEYMDFFRHMQWHSFNRMMEKKKPIIDLYNLRIQKSKVLESAFKNAIVHRVLIPNEIGHKEYLKEMKIIIENMIN